MRAFVVPSGDGPPLFDDLPVPVPGPGEVLVRVAACGLNFADLLMLAGTYQDTPPRPFVPGLELAGHVERLGPGLS
jgi:NADPH2:quinone reductase